MSLGFGVPALFCGGRAVEFGRYGDGGVAITLLEASGEPYAIVTVNLAPYGSRSLTPAEVWLKTWGGQDKLPAALTHAGVVTLTGETMVGDGAHPTAIAKLAVLTPAALAILKIQEGE